MEKKKNNLPLDGILVLDLTNVLSGPFATLILSDLGAKVIKIEKPGGDDSRGYGPFANGKSGYFISLNRGKKSICLDLKKKKEKQIFEKILSKSDVLIDNFKPETLEKLGFSWKYLSKKYPRLIYSKISGFGETGPLKDLPAYDIIVQAMGGLMSITGKDEENLVRVGTSIGDITASLFAVIGILSQLIRRNKTNSGSKLDLSMLDCQVSILENAVARYSIEGRNPKPLGTDHPSISPFGAFKTKDGILVLAIGNDRLFEKFCNVLKNKKLAKKYSTNKKRNDNLNNFKKELELIFKKNKTSFWIKKLTINKIPCAKINSVSEITRNKQILHRKMISDYPEKLGKLKVTHTPFNFDFVKNKPQIKLAPNLDEHRNEILKFFGIN